MTSILLCDHRGNPASFVDESDVDIILDLVKPWAVLGRIRSTGLWIVTAGTPDSDGEDVWLPVDPGYVRDILEPIAASDARGGTIGFANGLVEPALLARLILDAWL